MATATQLVAANTISNAQGLAPSSALLTQISTLQNQPPIKLIANLFATATTANANISSTLNSVLSTLGSGVTSGQWLIDLYPPNVTPVTSSSVYYYDSTSTPVYNGLGVQTGVTVTPVTSTASFSNTLKAQAQMPFVYGVSEFANVYMTASAYCTTAFDVVSSATVLQGKTYAQSGIGFQNQLDLVTNGMGTTGPLLGGIVASWGTMYDIAQISSFNDPYVFGQNLLNQGLGNYGGLSDKLTAVGLNITNLSAIPTNTTTTTQSLSTATSSAYFGQVELPVQSTTTTTTTVTGNSPDVVMNIYSSITGQDLQAIIDATGIVSGTTNIKTLADFLDMTKVVSAANVKSLAALSVCTFSDLATLLNSKLGQGYFTSWADMSKYLSSFEVPAITHLTASASTPVLSSSIASSLFTQFGTGTGPFNTPILVDLLGATAGMPHTGLLQTINNNYSTISKSINLSTLVAALDSAVTTYVTTYDGLTTPSTTAVTTAVNNINTALNTLSSNALAKTTQSAFYQSLNHLTLEVTNITKAGVVFNSGMNAQMLRQFGMNIGSTASDKTTTQTYQFFANLITNDAAGDTIKLAIAENLNTAVLATKGIASTNDPQTRQAIAGATSQNIPLTTYLSRNK